MSSVQHLQHKREELQQQYDLLSEKIKRLRNNSATEAGTLVAFQLEHEIERFEAQRDHQSCLIYKLYRVAHHTYHLTTPGATTEGTGATHWLPHPSP